MFKMFQMLKSRKNSNTKRRLNLETLEARQLLAVSAGLLPTAASDPLVVTTLQDVVSSSDDVVSLREALASAADGDTVTFAVEGTITLASVLQVNAGITIDGGSVITIDGDGSTALFEVLGANTSFLNLTLADGNNTSGLNNNCGGAISYLTWDEGGMITIDNCDFIGNNAMSNGGGAIYIFNAGASITNCTFSRGDYASACGWVGSGLFLATLTHEVVIDNCEFTEMNDSYFGGAFYISDGAANITISNSSFHDNGNYRGSSIYASSGSVVNVVSCTFEDNAATQGYGGETGQFGTIYGNGATITLTDCDFTGNTGNNVGGAVFVEAGSTLSIFGGSFTNNTVNGDNEWGGGAVGVWDSSKLYINTEVTVNEETGVETYTYVDSHTTFSGNMAYAADSAFGGAIWSYNCNSIIANAAFTGNAAVPTEGTSSRGGAVHLNGGEMTFFNCLFAENTATDSGGAFNMINSADNSAASFDYCTFTANTADNGGSEHYGDAIFTQREITMTNSIIAGNGINDVCLHTGASTFTAGNSVVGTFSCVASSEENITLDDSVITYESGMVLFEDGAYTPAADSVAVDLSSADRYGLEDLAGNPGCSGDVADAGCYEYQAVVVDPLVVTTLDDVVDASDSLVSLREALASAADGDTVTFAVEGTITLASVLQVNAGITIDGGSVITIDGDGSTALFEVLGANTSFLNLTLADGNNTSGLNNNCGGAISYLTWDEGGMITIDNCDFIGNNAMSNGGGAIYIFNAGASITNCTFSRGDYASACGWVGSGLFLATLTHEVVIDNCEFTEMNDSYFGGAFYISDGAANITISNSSFHDNGNYRGSSIYASSGSVVNVVSCTFEDNAATQGYGGETGQFGTIYGNGATITLTDCDFTGNTGNNVGGAVFVEAGSTLSIFGGSFTNNTVNGDNEWGGGAVGVWDSSKLYINTEVTVNEETGVETYTYVDSHTTFSGNMAYAADSAFGGAIWSYNCNSIIANAAFTGNAAVPTEGTSSRGGAVHLNGGEMTFFNCLFAENTATDSGGAFNMINSADNSAASFDYCTFTANTADNGGSEHYGDAIFTQREITMTNSIIAGNGINDVCLHTGASTFTAGNSVVGTFSCVASSEENITLDDSVITYESGMVLFEDGAYTPAADSVAVDLSSADRYGLEDLAGNPGCSGDVADAGCYEYQGSSPAVTLDAPVISTGSANVHVSYGANRHQITWGAVENASGYELAYSTDGAAWTAVEAADTSAVVTGLTYGADVAYRVRALGEGSYADSDWSDTKTFNVCPMDINGDGDISNGDRTYLAKAWLSEEGDDAYQYACDINADGDISNGDRTYLSSNWLAESGDDDLTYPQAAAAKLADAAFASIDLEVDLAGLF